MTTTSAPIQASVAELISQAEKHKYNNRERSFEYAYQALKLAEQSDNKEELIHSLLLAAYSYHHRGLHDQFFNAVDRAFELLNETGDKVNLAYAHYLTACCFRNLGDYSSSAENFIKGLSIAEEVKATENIIRILNGLGHLYNILGDQAKALDSLCRGIKLIKEFPDPHIHANLLGNQAEVFIELKRYDEAKSNLNYVAGIYAELNDMPGSGVTKLRLGKLHYAIGEVEESASILSDLYTTAVENDFRIGITVVGAEYSRILIEQGMHEIADEIIESAFINSNLINYNNQHELYFLKYKIALWKEDYKAALEYYELYQDLKEKTYRKDAEIKLRNAESLTEIQLVKKEAELNRLKHVELKKAYDEIEIKNREITDSIRYARRIQSAILPDKNIIASGFPDHFIFFEPRNIVSGDFYWFKACVNSNHRQKLLAVADCTGHGVPGSLMSMIGSTLLNQVIIGKGISEPSLILEELDKDLCSVLKTNGSESRDGMDISVALFDEESRMLHVSSAMRPVYVYHKASKELIEIPATKRSIGGSVECSPSLLFKTKSVQLSEGDRIYMSTDGFPDQFGGPKGKKLMAKNFKSLLQSTALHHAKEQGEKLHEFFQQWKGELEQVDDVTLMCIQVK